jgi:hypothetical protein
MYPDASLVSWEIDGTWSFGFIQNIWSVAADGRQHTFMIAATAKRLEGRDQLCNIYTRYPRLKNDIIYADERGPLAAFEAKHIVSHLVFWRRPAGTFDITQPIMHVHSPDRMRTWWM